MNTRLQGACYDGLTGGSEKTVLLRNAHYDSETSIVRGELLCGAGVGASLTVQAATAADATNGAALYIAAEDGNGDVITVFEAGRFNRNAIRTAEGVSLSSFELEMRRQGLDLTEELR